jgi:hypothetical protein
MGRAKRRRQLAAALNAIQTEGAGTFQLVIITAAEGAELALAAACGDAQAEACLRAVVGCLRAIPARRPLCLTCETQLSGALTPGAVVLLSALRDDIPLTFVANPVCGDCAGRPGLRDRAIAYYRANVFRDGMRILPGFAPGTPARN